MTPAHPPDEGEELSFSWKRPFSAAGCSLLGAGSTQLSGSCLWGCRKRRRALPRVPCPCSAFNPRVRGSEPPGGRSARPPLSGGFEAALGRAGVGEWSCSARFRRGVLALPVQGRAAWLPGEAGSWKSLVLFTRDVFRSLSPGSSRPKGHH